MESKKLVGLQDGRELTRPGPLDENALALGLRIPLLIAPLEPYKKIYSRRINGHHGAGFPGDHSELQLMKPAVLGEQPEDYLRVIRWSRVQEGLRVLHSNYHQNFDHVEVSDDEHESFMAVLLNSAGYVPPVGVDVRGRKPREVRLTHEQLDHLHAPGVIHQQEGTHWKIGHFFGRYILKYGVDSVRNSVEAAKFLAADETQRQRLGYAVIRLAAEAVLDPAEPVYQSARSRGFISPERPERALRFMMKHFDERQPDYFSTLADQLAAA